MKKIITVLLFCLVLIPLIFAKIELQPIYSLQMILFRDDNGILEEISTENGIISSFPTLETDYSIKVLSPKDRILFDENIGVSFILNLEPHRTIQLDKTIVHVRVPYFDNAERIVVYHSNKEILNIDLSKEICNDNSICEIGENEYNCPGDCKEIKNIPFWLVIVISALIIILVYFSLKRLKK